MLSVFARLILLFVFGASVALGQASPPAQPSASDYIKQGQERLSKSDFSVAIADFTKAIEMEPRNAVAYCGRGRAPLVAP